jgi:uncharacterized RDD family membrane protein YckC
VVDRAEDNERFGPDGWLPPETAPPPVSSVPPPPSPPPPPPPPQPAYAPPQPPPPQPGYGPFGGYTAAPAPPARRPRGPHGQPTAGRFECAGWWARAGAFLIDWAIALAVPLAVGVPLIAKPGAGAADVAGTVVVLAGPPLLFGLYAAALMARGGRRNGQTLGKQAARIRVARDSDEPVSFGYGLVRELAVRQALFAVGSSVVFGIPYLLDYLWPLWDESNRALHDMIVSSHVVRAEPVTT